MPATALHVDELIAQFTGVRDEQGGWETTGVPTPGLALELCRRLQPESVENLLAVVFELDPNHEVSYREHVALLLGYRRWRKQRTEGRGL